MEAHQESFQLEIIECDAESERKRKMWVTRARRVGEWYHKKGKAVERASGTCKHYICRGEDGRTKRMKRKRNFSDLD